MYGYFDFEYMYMCILMEKLDVYLFGVVFFEVLCARLVFDRCFFVEEQNLVDWVMLCKLKKVVDKIVD